MSFVHLHTHSHYSLLDGLSKVQEMVKLAKKYEMPALGLTDHGNMYGAIEFYKACKKNDIKPIIGLEAYVTPGNHHDKRPGIDTTRYHLTLLAKNKTGYQNLIKLVTKSFLEGYYYKPRIDKELMREYSEGLICLSGCFGGELSRMIRNGNLEKAGAVIKEHQEIYGKENYFIEVMHHPGVEGIEGVKKELVNFSKKFGIPLVGTQDSHYLFPEDQRAHETLLAVQTNADLSNSDRFSMSTDDYSFIDYMKAQDFFKDIPEAVENTVKVADMCDIELELGSWVFPELTIPNGTTPDEELSRLALEGIPKRELEKTPVVIERLDYELDIIKTKGYAPYFLVVADLIRFARESGILTNIRGSVAGSLTTYLLGITNVDPLAYKLPFERFLNPERPSAPDIDMDFADNRRDEVIEYTKQKYGEDKVAQIGTFGTMLAKGAVRDVARALGHPYAVGDKIANLIPLGSQGFPMTIERAMGMTPELQTLYDTDAPTKEIIDLAKRLEGCVRHVSVHAAGVVIAPTPLTDFVPTQLDPRGGKVITQYDMHAVEDAGLLKFDFLGIRNLAILEYAVRLVRKLHNAEIDVDHLPLDDKKTFEMLARGETMGVFQLSGSGMTKYLMDLKPTTVHDINAMVALYRPGPMENIPHYIARKHGRESITHLDPRMKGILDQSYGILTYQDDVLLIAINLAGYSWLEADQLRKAMGKKIPEVMAEQKEKFLAGCVSGGMTNANAQKLWELIEPFAAYGFNKAHAASYGNLAYQTAYMKANYPVEYMAAVLTADAGETEKVAEIITECSRMRIPVLPPNVNESFGDFAVVQHEGDTQDEIRFGLYSIKNFGREIANFIISERKSNGPFESFSNFLERIQHRNLNKKSLESLIKSGAMDAFAERGQMLANMDEALAYNKSCADTAAQQTSLFGLMEDASSVPEFRLKEATPADKREKLAWERELLGLFVSGHPLEEHKEKLDRLNATITKVKQFRESQPLVVGGIIEEVRQILTSKGDQMAFVKIADMSDAIETVVFPGVFATNKEFLEEGTAVIIKGKMSHRNGGRSVIIDKMKRL